MPRVALVALLLAALSAHAAPPLVGTWHSDRDRTIAFARAHAKIEEKTVAFLEQAMGRLTLVITATHISSDMPDYESTTVEGVTTRMVGFREIHPYRKLGASETQVSVLSAEPVTGRSIITVYNFDDENTMWIYVGGPSFPDLNIREYFVRTT